MAKVFKCEICSKKFSDKSYLASHMYVHTSDTPFSCPECPYRGKTKKYLARHKKKVHTEIPGNHKCNVCGKLFLHPSGLKVHNMVHTGEKPHKCKVCGKSFRVTYSLNSHMLIHANEKPFACSFCDYACRDSSTLRKHQNKHMGLERIYQCKICNKGYKFRAALKIHIAETHLDIDMKKFPCTHCDKMFKTNAHRQSHIESLHKRSLVCNCPICNRRILNKHNLASHMRTHLKERPFSCSHPGCNTSFKDKNSLTKHTVIHNPEMHFPCQYCGRKFARKSHRKQHELVIHVNRVKKYECDSCGSKFYTKNYLIKHIQTKHVHKQHFKYICDMCGLITHNKPSIVMHLKYGHTSEHDLECKICDNKIVYRRHAYLKQHYWKTHNIRYKTKETLRKDDSSVEVKVEPLDDSYEEIQMLDVEKLENEDESLAYSKSVLSEDITASVLNNEITGTEVEFDDFFIRHVFKNQTEKTEEKNSDGINKEQNESVKQKIKEIIKRTDKMKEVKEAKKKKKQEKRDRKKREKEAAIAQAKREREELQHLKRVLEMYNQRMEDAVAKEKQKKEQVKIKFFKHPKNSKEINEKDKTELEENSDLSIDKTKSVDTLNDVVETMVDDNDFENHGLQSNTNKESIEGNNEIDDVNTDLHNDLDNKTADDQKYVNNVENTDDDITENNKSHVENVNLSVNVDINVEGNNINIDEETIEENNSNTINPNRNKILFREKGVKDKSDDQDTTKDIDHEENTNDITKNNNDINENIDDEEITNEIIKDNNDINENDDDTSSDDDIPLLRRRKCRNKLNDGDINEKKSKTMKFKTFQCYVCFKLFPTKDELTTHCKEHFDICHSRTLSKCPLCDHVSYKGLAKHMRENHDKDLTTLHSSIKDTSDGSGYNYDVNGTIIQVIPSVNALNKTASNKIDKTRRELKDKVISKSKLVKKGNEWIVEKEVLEIKFDVLPEFNERELSKLKVTDTDVERLGQLSYLVKKKGLKMMFPCFKCDKICQNFCGLKLHQRRHEDNPKPFKPKEKNKVVKDTKKVKVDKANRSALPKPITRKHKCDEKLKEFFESNIRGGDIEFWQFLKIYNKMNREKVNDFEDLEKRSDFGNHLDYYKDQSDIE